MDLGDLFTNNRPTDCLPTVVGFNCLLSLSVGFGDLSTDDNDCCLTVVMFYCLLSLSVDHGGLFADSNDCWVLWHGVIVYCTILLVLVIYSLTVMTVGYCGMVSLSTVPFSWSW